MIRATQPDILLLQEIKCVESHFPKACFQRLGYTVSILGQKAYNGVAILSKKPVKEIQCGLQGLNDQHARYLEVGIGSLRVASIYVPFGIGVGLPQYIYKMKFLYAFRCHIEKMVRDKIPFIVGGDYNIAPYPEDVYDPSMFLERKILCSHSEVQALREILELGVTDALRTLTPMKHGQTKVYTWWDYRNNSFKTNKGFRIDHLLLSNDLTKILSGCWVDLKTRSLKPTSDHAPVQISLL